MAEREADERGGVVALRWLAFGAAGLTLVLITVGGLVTNTDSGLACPDWPMCFGTPFPRMVGGVLMEHGHRYIATAVGFLTTLLALGTLWRQRQAVLAVPLLAFSALLLGAAFKAGTVQYATSQVPPLWAALTIAGFAGCAATVAWARGVGRLAAIALLLVMAQGLLGGLTVIYRLPVTVLVLHLGTSMLFLGVALALAWRLRAPSVAMDARGPAAGSEGALRPGTRALLFSAAAAVYLQIVLGATVRHTGAGLVCTDLPLCRGALWPGNVHPAVHLHMAHRAFAFVVGALAVAVAVQVSRAAGPRRLLRALALSLPALVAAQIALGVLTISTFKDLVPVTAHLLFGALVFADCVSLVVLTAPASPAVREDLPAPRTALTVALAHAADAPVRTGPASEGAVPANRARPA
ncbi:MAG TPA: COX15/CtaA family protein [Myxococcales bacterium]|jgi:heme A synthase|nr:COX15/CtaA family protein [Myxococcales bacterium]